MASDLPRCVLCRARIEPNVNVTFRSDGRVQHATCPQVVCPVCSKDVLFHQPIRRDGEVQIHGNCWIKRTRAAARVVSLIRARLHSGALPAVAPTRILGGKPSDGAACGGCGESLGNGIEYEAAFADGVTVRFHRVCYGIWEEERARETPHIAGGSAASPWTVFFELRLALGVAGDRAAAEDFLAASAEALAASAASRSATARLRHRSRSLAAASRALQHTSFLLTAR